MLLVVAALVGAAVTAAESATADNSISSKQAQARAVLVQIQQMDSTLGKAIEAYDGANFHLGQLDVELRTNSRHLVIARQSLGIAQTRIASRLRALYVNGNGGGTVAILLGAENLDDLLNRIDAQQRVSRQDSQVLRQVRAFRQEVAVREARLTQARGAQAKIVAQRAADRRSIEAQLGERQRLLASIKGEIATLQAEEARRQAILAAQARARYLEQQRLQRDQQALAAAPAAGQTSTDPLNPAPVGAAAPFDPSTAAAPPAKYGNVVGIALQYLGVPYVWGGASPATGFDCSGLIMYVYAQVGVSLPHYAAAQYTYGVPVSRDQLQPGDLVFFDGLGHAGIYIGGNQFIHAPQTGDVVKISSLDDPWYVANWVGARRIT